MKERDPQKEDIYSDIEGVYDRLYSFWQKETPLYLADMHKAGIYEWNKNDRYTLGDRATTIDVSLSCIYEYYTGMNINMFSDIRMQNPLTQKFDRFDGPLSVKYQQKPPVLPSQLIFMFNPELNALIDDKNLPQELEHIVCRNTDSYVPFHYFKTDHFTYGWHQLASISPLNYIPIASKRGQQYLDKSFSYWVDLMSLPFIDQENGNYTFSESFLLRNTPHGHNQASYMRYPDEYKPVDYRSNSLPHTLPPDFNLN